MTADSIVRHPDLKLEDVRNEWTANTYTGRGTKTAAGRGYNTERLAKAVLGEYEHFLLSGAKDSWFDTFISREQDYLRVECKSCVNRYPSGPFGRFRIWRKNHAKMAYRAETFADSRQYLYFFVVYAIEDGIETEVGKLVVPVKEVDQVLDNWSIRDHPSMGEEQARDISWNLLLKRLDVSRETFREENTLDLTASVPNESERTEQQDDD
jgi:hypothetical protein